MSHHGHEDSMERYYAECDREALPVAQAKLASAVALLQRIENADPMFSAPQSAGNWLDKNGYECESSRRRNRERRATQLDAEIEKLRAERAKLGG